MKATLPKPRRWFRFSLRTLLVVVTLCALAMAWWVNYVRPLRDAVAALRAAGHRVQYVHDERPRLPKWLKSLVSVDAFDSVDFIALDPKVTDEDLQLLSQFRSLRELYLSVKAIPQCAFDGADPPADEAHKDEEAP